MSFAITPAGRGLRYDDPPLSSGDHVAPDSDPASLARLILELVAEGALSHDQYRAMSGHPDLAPHFAGALAEPGRS